MNRTEITSVLEDRFKRIEEYIMSKDGSTTTSYCELFVTESGKKLGNNMDKLQEFSMKGILTVFPFEQFVEALRTLYDDDRYVRFVKDASSEEGEKVLEIVKNEILPQLESSEILQLFNETDERVFVGALTTSLYSLLDKYTKDTLAQITSINGASRRIVRNLSSSSRYSLKEVDYFLDNPNEFYEEIVHNKACAKGISTRLKLIKSGTGVWDCIDSALSATKLGAYEQHFKNFIEFRNVVAHENPIPQIKDFLENKLIKQHIMRMKERFNKSLIEIDAPPAMLSNLFELV